MHNIGISNNFANDLMYNQDDFAINESNKIMLPENFIHSEVVLHDNNNCDYSQFSSAINDEVSASYYNKTNNDYNAKECNYSNDFIDIQEQINSQQNQQLDWSYCQVDYNYDYTYSFNNIQDDQNEQQLQYPDRNQCLMDQDYDYIDNFDDSLEHMNLQQNQQLDMNNYQAYQHDFSLEYQNTQSASNNQYISINPTSYNDEYIINTQFNTGDLLLKNAKRNNIITKSFSENNLPDYYIPKYKFPMLYFIQQLYDKFKGR